MKKVYLLFLALLFFGTRMTHAQAVIPGPDICMVSVDDSSTHNLIFFDKTQHMSADSFILYREASPNIYVRIMAQKRSMLSMFTDTAAAGNPNTVLHRYKLQFHDSVAHAYSQLGLYHTSIYCAQSTVNYNWNLYSVENSSSSMVTKYKLWQDDQSNGVWHTIDSMNNATVNVSDPNIVNFPNGRWRLVTVWNISCTPSAREGNPAVENTVVRSKSNITNNRNAGIKNYYTHSALYPNPSCSLVTLRFNFPVPASTTIRIFNSLGMETADYSLPAGKDELIIPVQSFEKGIYFVQIGNASGAVIKKLAVE